MGGWPLLRTFPVRPEEVLAQIREAYERGSMPARFVAAMFAISTNELYELVKRQRWKPRAQGLYAPEKTPLERAAEIRAAEAARQVALYGDAVDDVRLLRRCGYVVVREGERYRVGNSLCTLAALRAKAAREHRLLDGGHLGICTTVVERTGKSYDSLQ